MDIRLNIDSEDVSLDVRKYMLEYIVRINSLIDDSDFYFKYMLKNSNGQVEFVATSYTTTYDRLSSTERLFLRHTILRIHLEMGICFKRITIEIKDSYDPALAFQYCIFYHINRLSTADLKVIPYGNTQVSYDKFLQVHQQLN